MVSIRMPEPLCSKKAQEFKMRPFGDGFDQTAFPFQNHESVMNTLRFDFPRAIFEVLLFPCPTSFPFNIQGSRCYKKCVRGEHSNLHLLCGEKTC